MIQRRYLLRLVRRLIDEYSPIPDGVSGKVEITTKIQGNEPFDIIGVRESYYTGLPCLSTRISGYPLQILTDDGAKWMSNHPAELVQMWKQFAGKSKGRALIGGLGLGCVAKMCAQKRTVDFVEVVENNPDVIALVTPYLPTKVRVIEASITDYLDSIRKNQYDCCFLDIWIGTGEWVWQTRVVPLRRKISDKIRFVSCWQEQVMFGQVFEALMMAADTDEELLKVPPKCHYYAFRKFLVTRGYKGEPKFNPNDATTWMSCIQENQNNPLLVHFARMFVITVGCKYWEENFGKYWDEAWNGTEIPNRV